MMDHRSVLVVFMSLACLTIGQSFDFDCRREGVDCSSGQCNLSDGKCDCTGLATPNNHRCIAGGCPVSKYGATCAFDRVQVECSGDEMFVNINPEGFQGIVYVFGKQNVAACQLTKTSVAPNYITNKNTLEGWRNTLKYSDTTCGPATESTEKVNGTDLTTYTQIYFVQYNSNFRTSLDQKIAVKCSLAEGGGTKVTSGSMEVADGNSQFTDVNVDAESDLDVVTFSIKTKEDKDLPAEITLGVEIKLIFALTPGRGYVDFSLGQCSANNTETAGEEAKSITFVNEDCPTAAGQALFKNGIDKTGMTITVSIAAFMFSGGTKKVGFICDVKLCREANKDDCKKKKCDGLTSEADKQTPTTASPPIDTSGTNASESNTTTQTDGNSTTAAAQPPVETTTEGNVTAATTTTTATAAAGETVTEEANTPNTTSAAATTTAAAAVAPGNRRKRAAGDESDGLEKVYNEMTVTDGTESQNEVEKVIEEKDCMAEPEIITVVVILSVLVVLLFLLSLIITCHLIRSVPKKVSYPDDQRDTHVVSGHGFNIPRLEMTANGVNNKSYVT